MSEGRLILEISSYPPPHAGWAVRVAQVRRRLEQEGHTCVVLNIGESRRVPSPDYETVENGWVYLRKVWRFCRAGFLVHTHANGESPKGIVLALAGQVLASVAGRGSVLTFHAGIDQVYFPREKAPALVPIFRLLFGLPRAVICNAEAIKARIVAYGVQPAKVACIPAFSRQYLDFVRVELPADIEAFFGAHPRVLFSYLAMRPVYHPEVLAEAFVQVAAQAGDAGLFLCGVTGHGEDVLLGRVRERLRAGGVESRVHIAGDLTHDQFLTALTRSVLYVRTHVSDGVCSSVLEALALGVPVIACENGMRPPGVATYPPPDAGALARLLDATLVRGTSHRDAVATAGVEDTITREVELLCST
jgi:glycosyltransferase involved in cell wall biosynthesis